MEITDQAITFGVQPSAPGYTSTRATGVAPFTVASQTLVANLNAEMVGGKRLSDLALVTTKRHPWAPGEYAYSDYFDDGWLGMHLESAPSDTFRFCSPSLIEYWNGTSWAVWSGAITTLRIAFDGVRHKPGTVAAYIPHAQRKFRFTFTRPTGWIGVPSLLVFETIWSPIAWPGNVTVTIEHDLTGSGGWAVKDTAVFGAGTTGGEWGTHVKCTQSLHDGTTPCRVTVDIPDWVDSSGETAFPIRRLMLLSGYPYGRRLAPFAWDHTRQVVFETGWRSAGSTGVDANGLLGVLQPTPAHPLDVLGNARVSGTLYLGGGSAPGGAGLALGQSLGAPGSGPGVRFSDGTYGATLGLYPRDYGLGVQGPTLARSGLSILEPSGGATAGLQMVSLDCPEAGRGRVSVRTVAGKAGLELYRAGELKPRLVLWDTRLALGDGSVDADTYLERPYAGKLQSPGVLKASGVTLAGWSAEAFGVLVEASSASYAGGWSRVISFANLNAGLHGVVHYGAYGVGSAPVYGFIALAADKATPVQEGSTYAGAQFKFYPSGALVAAGEVTATRFVSTIPDQAPFTVASNLLVANLNAQYLNGQPASYYTDVVGRLGYTPLNQAGDTATGTLIFQNGASGRVQIHPGGATQPGYVAFFTPDGTRRGFLGWTNGANALQIQSENGWTWDFTSTPTVAGAPVWTSGNDGAASGLDADLLDGQHGSHYLARANHTGTQARSTISDFAHQATHQAGGADALTGLLDAQARVGVRIGTGTTYVRRRLSFIGSGVTIAAVEDAANEEVDLTFTVTAASGTVTSVQASGGSTGLTFSGGPITTSGTLTLGGTLALASGGTGATTAPGARTALGLGDSATRNVGTAAGTVAAGDHLHEGVYDPAGTAASALASHTAASDPHATYLNQTRGDARYLQLAGGEIATGTLGFGSTTRQMVNLWGSAYGIGVQSNTTYLRTFDRFAVHAGGSHSNTAGDPGVGGTLMLDVRSGGTFQFLGQTVWHSGNLNPASYLPLAGGTLSGGLSGTAATFTTSLTVRATLATLTPSHVAVWESDPSGSGQLVRARGLATLLSDMGAVPASRQVATTGSLTGGGALSSDRTLSLSGDEASPGASKYYGTNAGGTKGYHALPNPGGPTVAAWVHFSVSGGSYSSTISSGGSPALSVANWSETHEFEITVPAAYTNYSVRLSGRPVASGAGSEQVIMPVIDRRPNGAGGEHKFHVWFTNGNETGGLGVAVAAVERVLFELVS